MGYDDLPTAYDARMAARYDEDFRGIFGGEDRGDLAFFRRLAADSDGPVCEIGAGTGRVLLALAPVTGERQLVAVEPSAAMRAGLVDKLAREPALAARVAVVAGSFVAVPLPSASQGLVYAAFRSFQHVLASADQLAGLAEVKRLLMPGGRLALDLFDPAYAMLSDVPPARGAHYKTPRGTRVVRWESRRVERVAQLIHVTFRWVERAGRAIVADDTATYAVRYTFPWELLHLVARAGFVDIDLRGDYAGHPLGPTPRELVLTARSPSR